MYYIYFVILIRNIFLKRVFKTSARNFGLVLVLVKGVAGARPFKSGGVGYGLWLFLVLFIFRIRA